MWFLQKNVSMGSSLLALEAERYRCSMLFLLFHAGTRSIQKVETGRGMKNSINRIALPLNVAVKFVSYPMP